jgi:hypothetical protein
LEYNSIFGIFEFYPRVKAVALDRKHSLRIQPIIKFFVVETVILYPPFGSIDPVRFYG